MSHALWRAIVAVFGGAALALAAPAPAPTQTLSEAISERVRATLAAQPPELLRFYERRDFRPAWTGDAGPVLSATQLQGALGSAEGHGLRASDYRLPDRPSSLDPDTLARFELALTRAALAYGSALATGQVDPTTVNAQWTAASRSLDVAALLARAVDSWRVPSLAAALAPAYAGYERLRSALARYRAIAARGGWPAVPAGPPLNAGDRDVRVPGLRSRLAAEGELGGDDGSARYDSALAAAVLHFQARHGLTADGAVGAVTLAALNVPAATRVRQIELNLERWRWLPRPPAERYVLVSIPAFELAVVEAERPVVTMRAIVGRPDWPTPILSARISGLVFAPVWNIPPTIAREEVVPAARRDTAFLRREGIRVFRDSAATGELDPATLDWSQVNDTTFPWQLRQDPGGTNPLGGVKFVFPNRFDVCIHDTPQRAPFRERVRAASHGCVRVERAAALAEYLLHDAARWSEDSIRAAMTQPTERWVTLPQPVTVHLCYWTVWVDDAGTVQFRDDVYGWDAQLAKALAARRGN
ncbi:MAG TPA: L,D-transpeptidase family protein [Gemmatimonadales bacterium]|nr:L,D-transpeptidase family protein [Gemmatimonadales bacterium]